MPTAMLLVEDNLSDEKLALLAFAACGVAHQMVVRRDGAAALQSLFDVGQPLPAVVLLDLKLPKVDGLEVLRQLRQAERTHLLPVVVLTASTLDADVQRCLALGANAYVRKPVDFTEFARVAKTLAHFWLEVNQSLPDAGGAR